MPTATLIISSIEEKPCQYGIHNFKAAKYARTHTIDVGKCLYVTGIDEMGNDVHFWTPQAIIKKTTGMLCYDRLSKNTGGFFQVVEGDTIEHKSPFDDDIIMPVVIEDTTKIVPSIQIGQSITVSFKTEESKFGSRRLKIVRLIQN